MKELNEKKEIIAVAPPVKPNGSSEVVSSEISSQDLRKKLNTTVKMDVVVAFAKSEENANASVNAKEQKTSKKKSKKAFKIIAIILAAILALSAGVYFIANYMLDWKGEPTIVRGLHERTVTETNIDLVKGGATDYVIVTAENETNEAVKFAVEELRQNFYAATGIDLKVKKDSAITYSENAKILSIGETSCLQQAGITLDKKELGRDGYIVQTKGSAVFMVGASGDGTIYAVYGWLKEQLGYEYYAIDEMAIEKDVTDEKLLNVTLKERPDFDYRLTNFGEAWFDNTIARRTRFTPSGSVWVDFEGVVDGVKSSVAYHTSFNIVSPDIYNNAEDEENYHPDWYAPDGKQLCFSRDPENLAKVVVERITEALDEYPDRNILTFTQQDHNTWCNCETCTESLEQYGTNSAVYILFMNRIAEGVTKWVEENYPGREVLLAMFAYQQTEDAPVVKKGNEYVPVDEKLRLHENVALFYCPIFAEYYYDFNAEQNVNVADTLDKWCVLAKTIFTWIYGANFQVYLAPHNNFNSMQNNYRFLYDRGTKYIFDQHQYNQVAGTDWYRLKAYLSSNLQWKIDSNQEELINNFFTNYYKDASSVMKQLFDEENTWFAYLAERYGYSGKVSYTTSNFVIEEYWPKGLLENWLGLIDEAYEKIEHYQQTDPALYEKLRDRINLESITFRYMQIQLYKLLYSENDSQMMIKTFKEDCLALGITQYKEGIGYVDGGKISGYLDAL